MRFSEIVEAVPVSPVKPLTPAQATKRAARINKVEASANDVAAGNALRLRTAKRKVQAAKK